MSYPKAKRCDRPNAQIVLGGLGYEPKRVFTRALSGPTPEMNPDVGAIAGHGLEHQPHRSRELETDVQLS